MLYILRSILPLPLPPSLSCSGSGYCTLGNAMFISQNWSAASPAHDPTTGREWEGAQRRNERGGERVGEGDAGL